ncbi:sensor domain-containing diguanylate cyclase [Ureibacillus massiliensis]|uniref:sensor domain-containing diguanylate cyclase n=1 Tax=Ureibacillus massiliensis TaxID=292806 RepID=UPI00068C0CF7|nr:sensor domain-containing diguanylate cyclase [Ureibacillus massiliensis]
MNEVNNLKPLNEQQINMFNYYSLYSFNSDAIFTINEEGYIVDANKAAEQLCGYPKETLEGLFFTTIIDINDQEVAYEKLQQSVTCNFEDFRLTLIHKNKCKINCLVQFIPVDKENIEKGMFLLFKDMSAFDELKEKIAESQIDFQTIAENVQDVIVLMDENKHYLFVSPSCTQMFGYNSDEIVADGRPFLNIHQDYLDILEENFDKAIESGKPFKVTIKAFHKDKGWIWIDVDGTSVFDNANNFRHMLIVARDVTIQKAYENQLKQFAYYDSLTGLPNRRFFKERINEKIHELNTKEQNFALVLLDIDDFKKVNDQWGHEVGDQAIIEFANRIKSAINDNEIAARLGGDEFIVLLDNAKNEEDVLNFVMKIKTHMKQPFSYENIEFPITTSIGASICKTKNMNDSYFIKSADVALYNVKEKGKNQIHINFS